MAWIASDQSLVNDRRTISLAILLNRDIDSTLGVLHRVWYWAVDNVPPDGNLAGITDDHLAWAVNYHGEVSLSDALRDAGWLTVTEHGVRFLADWWHIGGKFQESRRREAERQRGYRTSNVRRTLDGRTDDVRQRYLGREPNLTQPNQEDISISSSSLVGVEGGRDEHLTNVRRTGEQAVSDEGGNGSDDDSKSEKIAPAGSPERIAQLERWRERTWKKTEE